MIFENFLNAISPDAPPVPAAAVPMVERSSMMSRNGAQTISGQRVSPESSKKLSTAYRCGNIISDDVAIMPMQMFRRVGRNSIRIEADDVLRNAAYLMEIAPNRWMTPFIFKKTAEMWLIYWGNAYVWQPPTPWREWFLLPANLTTSVFDPDGNLWFQTTFPNGAQANIPDVEILHLMINSTDGINGRSVIEYARETLGGQMGAHETKNRINGQGLNPGAILWVNGEMNQEARNKTRNSYTDAIRGSANAGGVAVFDSTIAKFEAVTMKPSDAQFLESIEATDAEIANFFGVPLYKLNMGKQSYESNTQQKLDYLDSLNPHLVQWEQAARLKWLSGNEQRQGIYFKFIREALMQMDPTTRATYIEKQIVSGQMTPNQACEINDLPTYKGGDSHYLSLNVGKVDQDGNIQGSKPVTTAAPAATNTAEERQEMRDYLAIHRKGQVDKLANEEPVAAPVQVNVYPQINVPAAEVTVTNEVQPATVEITNQVQPADVQVTNEVNIPDQSVTVNVPEQAAAQVTVNLPEQAAPQVTVNLPEEKNKKITFKRDAKGNIASATEVDDGG
jgi:HK97 family phage portal protein